MRAIRIISFYLFLLSLPGGIQLAFSQNEKQIDSLKKELVRWETRKNRPATSVPQLADTVKVKILDDLITIYYKTDPEKAFELAIKELALSEKLNYNWGISNSCNALGVLYGQKSNYTEALKYHQRSLKIKKQEGNKIGQEDSYYNIGVLYAKQANYTDALSTMMKGLDIGKSIKDSFGIFGGYNNIGAVYMAQNNYTEALKIYFKCLNMTKQLKDTSFVCVIYQNIGEIYALQHKYDSALEYFELGLKTALLAGDKESAANNYSGIGGLYEQQKKYDKALVNSLTALRLRQEISDGYGISSSYITIGNIYFMQGDTKKAIAYIEKGLELVKKTGELDILQQAYKYLSDIYKSAGNYKKAYENQILYKQVADSIFTTEKEEKLNQLQLQYNSKSVQDSIKAVQDKKDAVAQKAMQDETTNRNSIFMGMSILIVFLLILIVQRNKLAKIKRQKALEQERNRISRDLHDDLGAQLSTARMFISTIKNNSDNAEISATIESSIGLLDASINDLRTIMQEMHSSVLLEKGYLVAIETLVNKINQLHLIQFTLNHYKMDRRLDPKLEQQLYRITQELINNTLKYAKASNVSIDLLERNGNIILMYEDDGVGYDITTVKMGNGLHNITTRVASMGGNVEFDAMPDAGSRTIIEIPLQYA